MPVVDWCGFRSLPVRVDEPSVGEGGRDCEVTDAGIDHLRAVLPQAMQMDARSSPLAHPPTRRCRNRRQPSRRRHWHRQASAAWSDPTAAPCLRRSSSRFRSPSPDHGSGDRVPHRQQTQPRSVRTTDRHGARSRMGAAWAKSSWPAGWRRGGGGGLRSTLTLDLEPASFLPRRRRRRCACPLVSGDLRVTGNLLLAAAAAGRQRLLGCASGRDEPRRPVLAALAHDDGRARARLPGVGRAHGPPLPGLPAHPPARPRRGEERDAAHHAAGLRRGRARCRPGGLQGRPSQEPRLVPQPPRAPRHHGADRPQAANGARARRRSRRARAVGRRSLPSTVAIAATRSARSGRSRSSFSSRGADGGAAQSVRSDRRHRKRRRRRWSTVTVPAATDGCRYAFLRRTGRGGRCPVSSACCAWPSAVVLASAGFAAGAPSGAAFADGGGAPLMVFNANFVRGKTVSARPVVRKTERPPADPSPLAPVELGTPAQGIAVRVPLGAQATIITLLGLPRR